MENLETLKKELLNQKALIEKLSGIVTVANQNPSPFEITEGIKTLPSNDLTDATATEADVAQGKTFYSGNATLKMGTAIFDKELINALFMTNEKTVSYDGDIYYAIPDGQKSIKKYCFYQNYNTVHITFNDDLQIIDEYSFYGTKNFVFENFDTLEKLTKIGMHAFEYGVCTGMNITQVPNCVETLGTSCFENVKPSQLDYKFPDSLSVLGQSIYRQSDRTLATTLDLSNFKLTTLTAYTFYNIAFNCDLTLPTSVTTLGMYFNYDGCFKNITLPSTLKTMQTNCFGANTTSPISNFYLNSITFEGENPPSISTNCFASQHMENGFKIYVPDNAIEEYKNITNLTKYVDYIHPVSEKE